MAARTVAGCAGCHQDRTGEHGGRFEQQFLTIRLAAALRSAGAVRWRVNAREHGIERNLLQYEPPVVAAIVDSMQVPLSEVMIRALARRVIEVVSTWVN